MQHSPRVFFLSCYSQLWERLGLDEAPQSLTHGSAIHLRTQAATISLQESLYPLLQPMLSVYWQVPRQQPSQTPAPPWKRRTAPAELWVASNNCVVPKHRNALHDECRGVWALCRHSKNACCSLITPVPRSSDENSSCNTERLCAGAKGALSLLPVAHGDGTSLAVEKRPNVFKKTLCYTTFIWKNIFELVLDGKVVQGAVHLRASDDPPSTVPLEARVVTHSCQLCPRSIFMEVRGFRVMTRFSTFPVVVSTYITLSIHCFTCMIYRCFQKRWRCTCFSISYLPQREEKYLFSLFDLNEREKEESPRMPTGAWIGWILCIREISVSWGLVHWQSRLLIAVIWDMLSVSMSTLNLRNCLVPIWLSIFHPLQRAVKYKLQVTYTVTEAECWSCLSHRCNREGRKGSKSMALHGCFLWISVYYALCLKLKLL